jgi:hypothetical protein
MNIFCLDKDPLQSARWLCDQHCNKMVLESAQMVANCFPIEALEDAPKTQKGTTRKYSYWKHPCSIWARETMGNLSWLLLHSLEMEEERKDRGYNPHFSADFLKWALQNMTRSNNDPSDEQTEFAIAIADDKFCRKLSYFKNQDAIGKYRLYYKYDKPFATWKQNKPKWI